MPYSIDEPDKLPPNVQKLPNKLKRQWIAVWNSSYKACQDSGGSDCETEAFKRANGVIKRRKAAGGEMTKQFLFFDLDTSVLTAGHPFDGVTHGTFWDMYGRKTTINKKDMASLLANTKAAIESTKTEGGEVVGLPIDAEGHDKGDGAGWIVDASLEEVTKSSGKVIQVIRFVGRWTEIGKELIEKNIRRFFSPTIDLEEKVVLGGSLTNWPATRDSKGNVLLRPIEMAQGIHSWELTQDSLDAILREVYSAFMDEYSEKEMTPTYVRSPWIAETFDDYVVVEYEGDYWKVGYEYADDGEITFASRTDWKKVKKSWVEAQYARNGLVDLMSFDDSAWDAGAVRSSLDVGDLRKVSLLDLNGYPGQEGDPTKGLCHLPYKKTPGSSPNKAAIRACGSGARGITAVVKPDGVPQDFFNSERKKAANKLISMWPQAFDKPAPPSIYRIAGKEPPAEAQEQDEGDNIMLELTKEELATLVNQSVQSQLGATLQAEMAKYFPQAAPPPAPLGPDGKPIPPVTPPPDILKLLEMGNASTEIIDEYKKAMLAQQDELRKAAAVQVAQMVNAIRREANIREFVTRAVGGDNEVPYGIPVIQDKLQEFCNTLDQKQFEFFSGLIGAVQKGGLTEFSEVGHGKQPKGSVTLPVEYVKKLDSGEMTLADLKNPILASDLGDLAQYDLSQWQPKP